MLSKPQSYTELTTETANIPTFADVLWVYEYEGDSFAKTRYGCLLCYIIKDILSSVNIWLILKKNPMNIITLFLIGTICLQGSKVL